MQESSVCQGFPLGMQNAISFRILFIYFTLNYTRDSDVDFPLLTWSCRGEMQSDMQDALSRWLGREQRSPKVRVPLI